jgi:AcrR family transcriptional regulator
MSDATPSPLERLWGAAVGRERQARLGLSLERIVASGVELADNDGLAAVSMKRVAERLGFTTMSLYRYVDSRDELGAVMLDVALGAPDLCFTPDQGWRDRITAWARQISERRMAHPWTVEARQSSPPLTPNAIEWMERGLEALLDTGLTSQQRLSAMLAIDGWNQNHVRQSVQMGLVGPVDADSPQAGYLEHIALLIDADRFPRLAAAGPEALGDDGEDFFAEEFDSGLGLLLDGIEALIARSA